MKRPIATTRIIRSGIGDSGIVAILMAMAGRTKKSRKRKEYFRHVIRIAKLDPDQADDFIYFAATAASMAIRGQASVAITLTPNKTQTL